MKEKVKELFFYALPVLVCAGMVVDWIAWGYSDEGKIIGACIMFGGYFIYECKERKEFREWKKKRLKH